MTELVARHWCIVYWGKACPRGGGRHNCDLISQHEQREGLPHRCECGDTRAVGLVFR